MSRPGLAPHVLAGLRAVARQALHLTAWAILLVAGVAGGLACLFPVGVP